MTTPQIRRRAPAGESHGRNTSAAPKDLVRRSGDSGNKSTAFVTLLVCCIGAFGQVEAADTWSPTGSMSAARDNHTATLLSDLRHVLVTGGLTGPLGGSSISASAEIYDSWTGTWSSAASMSSSRRFHTATLLSNGGVLVTGGRDDDLTGLASAEIYHPLSNTWSLVASMSIFRQLHTATLLPDGRVLVVGGQSGPSGSQDSAELYDPVTDTWTSAGSMSIGRSVHTATLLLDGRVLVTGGENGDYIHFYLPFADIYDPVMNTWSPTDSMDVGRQGHTATRLADGQVLVTGGFGAGGGLDSAELYDPMTGTGTWSLTDSMSTDREAHTATLLLDDRVLVAGSFQLSEPGLASAETYDFDPTSATGTWSLTASIGTPRFFHTATRLLDGRVLVTGGRTGDITGETRLASAELFSYALPVGIDIKPNALPNAINLGSNGTVAVAILSTPSFDATTVDPNSVTLASAPVKLRGQGTPLASFDDVNGDGLDDLVLHVATQAFQLSTGDVVAILEGMTFDGTEIIGSDSIRIVP